MKKMIILFAVMYSSIKANNIISNLGPIQIQFDSSLAGSFSPGKVIMYGSLNIGNSSSDVIVFQGSGITYPASGLYSFLVVDNLGKLLTYNPVNTVTFGPTRIGSLTAAQTLGESISLGIFGKNTIMFTNNSGALLLQAVSGGIAVKTDLNTIGNAFPIVLSTKNTSSLATSNGGDIVLQTTTSSAGTNTTIKDKAGNITLNANAISSATGCTTCGGTITLNTSTAGASGTAGNIDMNVGGPTKGRISFSSGSLDINLPSSGQYTALTIDSNGYLTTVAPSSLIIGSLTAAPINGQFVSLGISGKNYINFTNNTGALNITGSGGGGLNMTANNQITISSASNTASTASPIVISAANTSTGSGNFITFNTSAASALSGISAGSIIFNLGSGGGSSSKGHFQITNGSAEITLPNIGSFANISIDNNGNLSTVPPTFIETGMLTVTNLISGSGGLTISSGMTSVQAFNANVTTLGETTINGSLNLVTSGNNINFNTDGVPINGDFIIMLGGATGGNIKIDGGSSKISMSTGSGLMQLLGIDSSGCLSTIGNSNFIFSSNNKPIILDSSNITTPTIGSGSLSSAITLTTSAAIGSAGTTGGINLTTANTIPSTDQGSSGNIVLNTSIANAGGISYAGNIILEAKAYNASAEGYGGIILFDTSSVAGTAGDIIMDLDGVTKGHLQIANGSFDINLPSLGEYYILTIDNNGFITTQYPSSLTTGPISAASGSYQNINLGNISGNLLSFNSSVGNININAVGDIIIPNGTSSIILPLIGSNQLYINDSGVLTTSASSARYKKNIVYLQDMPEIRSYIDQEQSLKVAKYDFNGVSKYGFIAEDIALLSDINSAVIYNRQGYPESLDYNSIFSFIAHDYFMHKKDMINKINILENQKVSMEQCIIEKNILIQRLEKQYHNMQNQYDELIKKYDNMLQKMHLLFYIFDACKNLPIVKKD